MQSEIHKHNLNSFISFEIYCRGKKKKLSPRATCTYNANKGKNVKTIFMMKMGQFLNTN